MRTLPWLAVFGTVDGACLCIHLDDYEDGRERVRVALWTSSGATVAIWPRRAVDVLTVRVRRRLTGQNGHLRARGY